MVVFIIENIHERGIVGDSILDVCLENIIIRNIAGGSLDLCFLSGEAFNLDVGEGGDVIIRVEKKICGVFGASQKISLGYLIQNTGGETH